MWAIRNFRFPQRLRYSLPPVSSRLVISQFFRPIVLNGAVWYSAWIYRYSLPIVVHFRTCQFSKNRGNCPHSLKRSISKGEMQHVAAVSSYAYPYFLLWIYLNETSCNTFYSNSWFLPNFTVKYVLTFQLGFRISVLSTLCSLAVMHVVQMDLIHECVSSPSQIRWTSGWWIKYGNS